MEELKKQQEEAPQNYQVEIEKNLWEFLPKLKSNILLHVQVAVGPFDVRHVNFDSICHLMVAKLDFDVLYPSGAAWSEFAEEWKTAGGTYLVSDPAETSVGIEDAKPEEKGSEQEEPASENN
ncbi:hypothetical protein J1N35_022777 [Gossypium stocksii]|uniref:Uncharacterized protein n=1 Tax=Gossypium stocksii TaxID=47602 RepID=A0A9D4A1G6_9ROSI|nr:hypothetical protein J1N35_022777 [Gossypium stocksii]